jgi:competence protein ComEC
MPSRSTAAIVMLLAIMAYSGISHISRQLEIAGMNGEEPKNAREAIRSRGKQLEAQKNLAFAKNDESGKDAQVPGISGGNDGRVFLSGRVLTVKKMGRGRVALVNTASGRYILKIWGSAEISAGDKVSFSGFPERLKRASKRGGFDEFLYWKAKGASGAISSPEIAKTGVSRGFARQRTLLEARIMKSLPPRTAGYLLAALAGTKDESLDALHRSVGTSHLLAVSGAHVGIVFAIFWFFLRHFRLRPCLISLVIWAYVMLAGAAASALRAALMIQLAVIGRIAGRSGNAFNTVSAAGAIMLIFNPWLFWDVGWRLSMIAVLTLSSLSAQKTPSTGKIFLASPLIWLVTSLDSSRVFGSVPVAGVIANLFALPAFAVLFPLAFICSAPSLAGAPFGGVFAWVPEFLFRRWERLSENILFLCPWEIGFSLPLLILGAAALAYLFASASGFGARRSLFAAAIIVAGGLACVL